MARATKSEAGPGSAPRLLPTAIAALLTRGVLMPMALVQGALLARGLGPAGLGAYAAALVDVNLLVALLSLGLPGGLAIAAGQARGQGEGESIIAALRKLSWRHGLAMAGALLVSAPLYAQLAPRLSLPLRTPAVLALIVGLVLLQFVRDVHNALLWGGQRFAVQNRINLLVQLALSVLLFVLWRAGWLQPESALGLQLAAYVLWIVAARSVPAETVAPPSPDPTLSSPPPDVSRGDLQARVRAIGLRSYVGVLLDLLLLRIDIYLIEKLVPPAVMAHELGLYQAGVRVAELVLFVPSTLNAVLFAKAAAAEDVALCTLRSAKLSLWLGLLALACMWLVGQPLLVLVFGARFAGSFAPCLWVLLGCVMTCFASPLAGTLSGEHGYPRSILWAQLLALLANVGANVYLLPRYGIVGAAQASALSYALSAGLIAAAFARRYGLSLGTLLRPSLPWTLWRQLRAA